MQTIVVVAVVLTIVVVVAVPLIVARCRQLPDRVRRCQSRHQTTTTVTAVTRSVDMLIRTAKEKEEAENDAGSFTDNDIEGSDNDSEDSTDNYPDPRDAAASAEDKEEAPMPAENARQRCVATGRKSVQSYRWC